MIRNSLSIRNIRSARSAGVPPKMVIRSIRLSGRTAKINRSSMLCLSRSIFVKDSTSKTGGLYEAIRKMYSIAKSQIKMLSM